MAFVDDMKCLCVPLLSDRSEIRRLRDSTMASSGVYLNVCVAMCSITDSRNFVARSSFNPYQI